MVYIHIVYICIYTEKLVQPIHCIVVFMYLEFIINNIIYYKHILYFVEEEEAKVYIYK